MSERPEARLQRLADLLVEQGRVQQRWAAAMCAVPRHLYMPELIYRHERGRPGNDLVPLRRSEHPDGWLDLVYADAPVNTQVDDGHPAVDGTGWEVTSSSSQPAVVGEMLAELCLLPGERVLEIGTGTGWNAALLAYTVGAQERHRPLWRSTRRSRRPCPRRRLDATGYDKVTTITGDGALGWADGAPYDRVIATAEVARGALRMG